MFAPGDVPAPALSVLVPVRNGAAYLDAALESLAQQTFRDFEVILIDNGSRDGTSEIVSRWAERDPRIRSFWRPRIGLSACLREAVDLARAPLLARLDADDLAAPDRFERQVSIMRANPKLIMIGTTAELIDGRGRRLGTIRHPSADRELRRAMKFGCPFVHSSVMMRTDVCRRSGNYRDGLNICEDYDLWLRLMNRGEAANLPDTLTSYRVHRGSLTSRQPVRMAVTALCVFAAARARDKEQPEPFIRGTPCLRTALELLGLTRSAARDLVRIRLIRHRVSRACLMLPVPAVVKATSRWAAHRLGPRRLYLGLLHRIVGRRNLRTSTLEVQA